MKRLIIQILAIGLAVVAALLLGLFMYYRDSKAKQKAAREAAPDQP